MMTDPANAPLYDEISQNLNFVLRLSTVNSSANPVRHQMMILDYFVYRNMCRALRLQLDKNPLNILTNPDANHNFASLDAFFDNHEYYARYRRGLEWSKMWDQYSENMGSDIEYRSLRKQHLIHGERVHILQELMPDIFKWQSFISLEWLKAFLIEDLVALTNEYRDKVQVSDQANIDEM